MPTALLVGLLIVWMATSMFVLALCLTAGAGEREMAEDPASDAVGADMLPSA